MGIQHRRFGRAAVTLAVAAAMGLAVAGCTAAPATPAGSVAPSASSAASAPSTSTPSASTSGSAPAADALTIDITIAGGKVTPSGEKINAAVGQQVIMNVTSDTDDEIHAHTGGDGYELEVPAGKATTGMFTLTDPGSFEVESHHLEKVIVILNAR